MSIFMGIFIPVKKQHMALGRPVNKDTQYKVIVHTLGKHVSSKVDFHQSGIEKGTRERVRSKVAKFGYHYKFLSSF